jgi:hypothetical protein
MPIAKLFLEGSFDLQVLNPILQNAPALQQSTLALSVGGSKYALKQRARIEREENKNVAGYLRDRDFDFDPPDDLSKPTVDSEHSGFPLGWRWCRHEIENYLIDPAVVSEAMEWPIVDIEEAILQAARKIRSYEAARWTVGIVRRALPPHYELKTRPDRLNDFDLPSALDSAAVSAWASNSIENHRKLIVAATDPPVVQKSFDAFVARFDDAFVADVANVLLWFSGKDILAGMADWLISKTGVNPGAFRASLRDWIIANPVRTLELLPEWNNLTEVLRA